MDKTENIRALVPYSKDHDSKFLFFVTKQGIIKRTTFDEYENINKNGKIRFLENTGRPLGRTARGVKGFNVDGGYVIGLATNLAGEYILTITENGFGKKSALADYRMTRRGARGVKTVNVTEKSGKLVCMRAVRGDEDCMIMTAGGIVIRISLNQVSVYSRSAQGVKVINVKDDIVSSVAILEPEEDSEVVDISHNEVLDEGVFEDASDDEDIIDNVDEEVTDSDSKE